MVVMRAVQYAKFYSGVKMFWFLLLVFAYLAYKWSVSGYDYFEKKGLPFDKPWPLVGNMFGLVTAKESLVYSMQRRYRKFKQSKLFGLYNFKQSAYVVIDPELAKQIFIKDFDHFVNHNEATSQLDRVFDRSLFSLHNNEWRDMRTTLSPMFTSSKMKMMFGLLSESAKDFASFFEERAKKGENLDEIDVLDVFARFTADGIATAVLGFEADCVRNKNSFIFKTAQKLIDDFNGPVGSLKFTLSFVMPKLYKALGLQCMSKEIYDFLQKVVVDVMNEREDKNISRPDVIQLLVQAKKGQLKQDKKEHDVTEKELVNFSANVEYTVGTAAKNASHFTDDDWIAQGFIFFAAGYDTTSFLLHLICYELAFNIEVQEELQNEIDSTLAELDGKPISYEALHKMKLLDMVVSEGLRIWPPAPQTDRSCQKDYNLKNNDGTTITIKKGEIVFFPIYSFHRDEAYWPNPNKFDPQRFSDENKASIVPGSYFPFGSGPRACIGSRFALMEVKLLLLNLFSKFSVTKCDKTAAELHYKANVTFKIEEKVFLSFKLRQ